MTDTKTSFWTPARIGAVIGAVLLIVALAVLVSLPQNVFERGDLLEPAPGSPANGTWMVSRYDQEYDKYLLYITTERDGVYEWDRDYNLWIEREFAEEWYVVIGSFDARKANL